MTGANTPDGLPTLSETIRRYQLSARKGLGQNFILDFNLTRRIARQAGPLEGLTVLEIGPGPGGLTRALLLEGADRVVAIERDARCLPILQQISERYPGKLEIVSGDALELELSKHARTPTRIVANLPYGVATELLVQWVSLEKWPPWYDRMVLMFQREVADRIVARPANKVYGRLSVLTQWRTRPRILFNLPAKAFTPAPKVESSLVEFVPDAEPEAAGSCSCLQRVTAAAFGQRRKMLRVSLRSIFRDADHALECAGIDPKLRAEALDVSQFCSLGRFLAEEMQ